MFWKLRLSRIDDPLKQASEDLNEKIFLFYRNYIFMHRHYFVMISNWFEIISGIFFLFDIFRLKLQLKFLPDFCSVAPMCTT